MIDLFITAECKEKNQRPPSTKLILDGLEKLGIDRSKPRIFDDQDTCYINVEIDGEMEPEYRQDLVRNILELLKPWETDINFVQHPHK